MSTTKFWAVCPVSSEKLDGRVVRLTGLLVALLLSVYMVTDYPILLMIVAADYLVRILPFRAVSPLAWIASGVVPFLGDSVNVVNKGSKIFAARLGFLCAATALLSHFFQPVIGYGAAGLLLFFAFLESVMNYCVGCVIYYALLRLQGKAA